MSRALHVITRLTLGGSSANTVAQIAALARAGWACELAVGLDESDPQVVAHAERCGCRVRGIPALGREPSPIRDLVALVHLVRLFRTAQPDVVHTHTSKAGFLGRLAARRVRVPAVIHQPHGHIFYGYYGPLRSALFIMLERLAARWTHRLVALTERGVAEHLERGIGRPGQWVVIPSGVDTEALRAQAPDRAWARARLGLEPGALMLLGVGRLVPVKGFDLLVAALGRLRARGLPAHLWLVGDGPERVRLAGQAERWGVTAAVHLVGAVEGAAGGLLDYLAAADLCVAPSRNEGMGRVLVEAMALGVPVVATRVGGIPAVVGEDEAGRLVPPEDVTALTDALEELARDAPLRAKLGQAARERAERFSVRVAEARLCELYAELAPRGERRV